MKRLQTAIALAFLLAACSGDVGSGDVSLEQAPTTSSSTSSTTTTSTTIPPTTTTTVPMVEVSGPSDVPVVPPFPGRL